MDKPTLTGTPEQNLAIWREWKQGVPIEMLAARYGVTLGRIKTPIHRGAKEGKKLLAT